MKKLIYVLAVMFSVTMFSCGQTTETTVDTVDTVVSDSVMVDTVA